MRRTYAIFDGANKGTNLILSNGNQIVTYDADSTNNHRMVRGSIALSEDLGLVEFLVYGTEALGSGKVYIGVVNASAGTSRYVGEDTEGFGYRLDNGNVYNNGASVETFTSAAKGDIIGLLYSGTANTCSIFKNGTLIGTIDLPAIDKFGTPDAWYFAVTVSGDTAEGLYVFENSGQQDFSYPTTVDGWWEPVPAIAPVLLATEPYMSASTDDLPNQPYDAVNGRIVQDDTAFSISRGVSFWVDGDRSSAADGVGSIRISDPEDSYARLLTEDVRDLPVVVRSVGIGEAVAAAIDIGEFVVERVEADGDFFKVIYLRGPLSQLDVRLQGRLFLPNAQEQAANRPYPVCIGAARNFEPILYDEDNHRYAASHKPMLALGNLRIKGRPAANTKDFIVTNDVLGFELLDSGTPPVLIPYAEPDGKFTAEISTAGGDFDPSDPDFLGGDGEFLTGTPGGLPDGWDNRDSTNAPTLLPYWNGPNDLRFPQGYIGKSYISISNKLNHGRSYAYEIQIDVTPSIDVYPRSYLCITHIEQINGSGAFASAYDVFDQPGTYRGHFTVAQAADQPLVLHAYMGSAISGYFKVHHITLVELPEVADNIDLEGASLEAYCREGIEKLGKLDASVWQSADAAAIDADTGYEIGNWIAEPTTVREALAPALDSFTSAIFPRRDGTLGICRLEAPEDRLPLLIDFDLGEDDFLSQMTPKQDVARGLTTQIAVRRNYSPYGPGEFGDFDTTVTDGVPVGVRKQLGRQYQKIVYSGVQVSNMYRHAATADPLYSLFDKPEHGQAEIDRVCTVFATPRMFYEVEVAFPPDSTLEVGQIGKITYSRHGLTEGKQVQIRSIVEYPTEQRATITFWG